MPPCLSRRVRVHLLRIRQPAVHALSNHPQAKFQTSSYLALAAGSQRDIDEAPSVQVALVGAALGGLGLLLSLDLRPGRCQSVFRDRGWDYRVRGRGGECGLPYLGGLRLDLACARSC